MGKSFNINVGMIKETGLSKQYLSGGIIHFQAQSQHDENSSLIDPLPCREPVFQSALALEGSSRNCYPLTAVQRCPGLWELYIWSPSCPSPSLLNLCELPPNLVSVSFFCCSKPQETGYHPPHHLLFRPHPMIQHALRF